MISASGPLCSQPDLGCASDWGSARWQFLRKVARYSR